MAAAHQTWVLLVAALVLVSSGPVAAVHSAPAHPTGTAASETAIASTGTPLDDPTNTTDSTSDTTNDTTDTVDETTNETTDTVNDTTNDTVNDTTNDTTDSTTNTTDTTSDTTNETTDTTSDTTNDTVNDTSDTVDNTTNDTTSTIDETVDTTTDTVNDTVEPTSETVNSTVEDTTSTANDTLNSTSDTLTVTSDSSTTSTDTLTDTTESVVDSTVSTDTTLQSGVDSDSLLDGDTDRALADETDGQSEDGSSGADSGDGSSSDGEDEAGVADTSVSVEDRNGGGMAGSILATFWRLGEWLPEDVPSAAAGAAGLGALGITAVVSRQWLTSAASTGSGSLLQAGFGSRTGGWLEKLRRLFVPLRYSRYDDSDPLEHDARRALYDVIEDTPGVYLTDLAARADVPVSTARHHVRVLADENLVTTGKRHGKRRYYPSTAGDMALADALSEPAKAAVIHALDEYDEAHVGRLADELDRDPSTVTHHLQTLADDDLVERERRGRAIVNRLSPDVAAALSDSDQYPTAADD